ncbi:response regulator [Anaerotalea alkaliphila]|uniref:Stage 0 sporulation protein A homolog n=1 Tax=Anaerotalea alkaliphila TaxID=2662126 RepID=A0A7X5HVC4_9FIRM|nr:response regulator transcription factor [Anaerotalea alkaliphila]NDL67327.1 response regulator transcription factor [Anaerotalea alkaliphila]
MSSRTIRVLVADDFDLIRQGVRRILDYEPDMELCGEAVDGREALALLKDTKPDILLLDMNMPLLSGIQVLEAMKEMEHGTRTIVLTVEDDSVKINDAIRLGADGYVLKESVGREVVRGIRAVMEGEQFMDNAVLSILFQDIRKEKKEEGCVLDRLTERELDILRFLADGRSNKEIGEQLFISEKTVKNYTTKIFRKLEVTDRVKATLLAIGNGIHEYYRARECAREEGTR